MSSYDRHGVQPARALGAAAIFTGALLCACSGERASSAPADVTEGNVSATALASSGFVVESSEGGDVLRVTKAQAGAQSSPVRPPGTETPLTAGCTHIRYCNAPGAAEVQCVTNDRASCTRQQRFNECISDADFVCGDWTKMDFLPPI